MRRARSTGDASGRRPPATVGTRAARGFSVTFARTLAFYTVTGLATVALARLLVPSDFGTYAIVASVNVLAYHLLAGGFTLLFVARPRVGERAVASVFWALSALLMPAAAALAALSAIALTGTGQILGLCLAATVAAAPFRFPATVLLNHRLAYGRLAVLELVEIATFSAVAVALAASGFGVRSFAVASLAGALALVAGALLVASWRPRFVSPRAALRWLRPALPYFAASWVNLAREAAFVPALALVLARAELGLYTVSLAIAGVVAVVCGITSKVLYPALAWLREERARAYAATSFALRWNAAICAGLGAVLFAGAPLLLPVVFSSQWSAATDVCRLLLAAAVLSALLSPAFQLMQADRAAGRLARWEALAGGLSWGVGLPAAASLGATGAGLGQLVAAGAVLVLGWRYCSLRYELSYRSYLLAALAAGALSAAAGASLAERMQPSVRALLEVSLLTALAFGALLTVASRGQLVRDAREARTLLRG